MAGSAREARAASVLAVAGALAILAFISGLVVEGPGWYGLIYDRWHNTLHDDSELFLAVGNGMRHGQLPWVDLFETKPPVVFWFARALIAVDPSRTGAAWFTLPLNAVVLVAPLAVVHRGLRAGPTGRPARITVIAISIIVVVSSLWIFTGQLFGPGLFESETFGVPLTVLSLLGMMLDRRRLGWALAIGAGALAVLSKETFAPLVFSLGAWISWTKTQALRPTIERTAIHVGGVLAVAVLLLAITGLFGAYFTVYLPLMGELRVADFWGRFVRAFEWQPVWTHLRQVSRFAPLLPVLWLALLAAPPGRWSRLIPAIGCLVVTLAMVGFGGEYWPQHFGHFFPWCVVMLWVIPWQRLERVALIGAAVLSIGLAIDMTRQSAGYPHNRPSLFVANRLAHDIDAIVKACELGTYQYIGFADRAVYGLTETPPQGPLFFQFPTFVTGPSSETYFARLVDQISRVRFVVHGRAKLLRNSDRLHEILARDFTQTTPPCAAGIVAGMPRMYQLWYRRR